MKERLQKIISHAGVCSRRKAEELIKEGRVKVNGHTVTKLGTEADSVRDCIEVNGKVIKKKNVLNISFSISRIKLLHQ